MSLGPCFPSGLDLFFTLVRCYHLPSVSQKTQQVSRRPYAWSKASVQSRLAWSLKHRMLQHGDRLDQNWL